MHAIDSAIIKTLCYADVFDYPLTVNQLYKKLITSKQVTLLQIKKHLYKLHQQGIICQTGSYYHLPNRGKIVNIRLHRQKYSQAKKKVAQKLACQLIKIPYISAVFLTGAVAVGNATENDDIDIMVVTASQKLWTARLLLTLWLEATNNRRRPTTKNIENKLCTNLFVTANSLQVPLTQQNLYTAHEVLQTQALADPYQLLGDFYAANSWINTYFANNSSKNQVSPLTTKVSRGMVERIVEKMQRIYMEPKRTREIINQDMAYFHPRDTAGIVLHEFTKKCKLYKI